MKARSATYANESPSLRDEGSDFTALSDVLIHEVSLILRGALDGTNAKYRDQLGYVIWDTVEDDFHRLINSYVR